MAKPVIGAENRSMEQLRKTFTALSIAAGLAVTVSACDATGDDISQPEPGQAQPAETPAGAGNPSPGGTGSAMPGERNARAAVETAVNAVRGSSAIELDFSDRLQAWEVDVFDVDAELEVQVSPDGSEVLAQRESGGAEPEQARELEQTRVSMSEALVTAAEAESGNVDEVTLGDEGGLPVWEIEIGREDGSSADVLIDAVTGEQIR